VTDLGPTADTSGASGEQPVSVLSPEQERAVRPITRGELRFYAFCRFVSVGLSRIWYPGRVLGRENLPTTEPYVLAPVHRSNLDWLVVARVTKRRLRYLVKGEVWKVKSVGRLLELLGTFPVQRGAADREALTRSVEVLNAGEPLVVFPEGTRGSGATVGELREGVAYLALRAGVPVIPVGMSGLEHSMPRGARFPRPARVRIVVGEPIYPAPAQVGAGGRVRVPRSATHELSERVRQGIQIAFDEAERRTPGAALEPGPTGPP
jgi:1-acyl-sn-glycerol-3-phosphate acyltransferase